MAYVLIDGREIAVKYADLIVVDRDGAADLDWEVVLVPLNDRLFEPGAYEFRFTTLENRQLQGTAIFVRSVESTHVFRGAGAIDGIRPTDFA